LLAWVRTGVALLAPGFVMVTFALITRGLSGPVRAWSGAGR
jgi:uncharacterized membrane protein YidH (DUF202 family)